jgi:class 3 adenylate cyclase
VSKIPSKYDDKLYRFDLLQKLKAYDKKTHLAIFEYTPNPARYDWKIIDGQKYLIDKMEPFRFSEKVYAEIMADMKGKNLYWVKPDIDNITDYIESRIPKIHKFLTNLDSTYEFKDKSEDFLHSLNHDEMTFVILCIDIIGSTKMSEELPLEQNSKIIQVFSKELAAIVDAYHGFVLKYVGDGLIAYFPEPNHLGMEDNAVDCAVTMKFLVENGINKILTEKGLPELKFRIGLDTGEAIVSTIGDISSKQHKDLIGLTINFAAKIQSSAQSNQIVIGESTKKQLHTTRKKLFSKYTPKTWNYHHVDKKTIYLLYSLNDDVKPHESKSSSQMSINENVTHSNFEFNPDLEDNILIDKYEEITKKLINDLKSISKINSSCASDLKIYDNLIKFSNRCIHSNMSLVHALLNSKKEFLESVEKYGISENTINNLYDITTIQDSIRFYSLIECALGTLLKGVEFSPGKYANGTEKLEEIKKIIDILLPKNTFFWDEIDIKFRNALINNWYYVKNQELIFFENSQLDNPTRLIRSTFIKKMEYLNPMAMGVCSAIGEWPRKDNSDFTKIDDF